MCPRVCCSSGAVLRGPPLVRRGQPVSKAVALRAFPANESQDELSAGGIFLHWKPTRLFRFLGYFSAINVLFLADDPSRRGTSPCTSKESVPSPSPGEGRLPLPQCLERALGPQAKVGNGACVCDGVTLMAVLPSFWFLLA